MLWFVSKYKIKHKGLHTDCGIFVIVIFAATQSNTLLLLSLKNKN